MRPEQDSHGPLRPQRAFLHPLWVAALAVLVANDHLLKGSGLLPGWLTGKLSDFAGMLVAPALLAVLSRTRTRRGLALCHWAVGVAFAAINLSPAAARALEVASGFTPLPWAITVDPTDLVALPALLLSHWMFAAAAARPLQVGRAAARIVQGAALAGGALACMATSPPPCEGEECPSPIPQELGSLTLANDSDEQRLVRVRSLKESVEVDCETLLADPTATLSRELFAPADVWLLEPGRALPLQNQSCAAYLVDAQGLDMTLLAWSESAYPTELLATEIGEYTERMIMMTEVRGSRLVIGEHPAVFEAPPAETTVAPPGCEVPEASVGLDWTAPPVGNRVIASIESSPDGCHLIGVSDGEFVLCLPPGAMPFSEGDAVEIRSGPGSGVTLHGQSVSLIAARGGAISAPPELDFSIAARVSEGCGVYNDECGNAVSPLTVTLSGSAVADTEELVAGEAVLLEGSGGRAGTFHLVRAQRAWVVDTACAPFPRGEDYFESVLVWNHGE